MGRVSTYRGVIRTILLALLVVCAPALAWADPTQPEAKTDPVWTKRHAIYVANAQTKGVDVVFLGDSITQFWQHNGTRSWADLSSAFRAVNLGMSGDQAGAWLINEAQNVGGHGHVREWMFTYNQGLAIGADVLRFRITDDRTFLDRASATARAALAVFTTDKLWTQPPPFNAVFLRNLLVLDHFAPDRRCRQALDSYLDRVW